MIDPQVERKLGHTGTQIFITLTIPQHMASRRHEPSPGNGGHSDGCPPRRRAVPIQDLLNPFVEERNAGPSHPVSDGSSHGGVRVMNATQYYQSHNKSSSQHPAQWRAHRSPRRSPPRAPSTRHSGTRREFRPTYSEEETLFIWYHRIDLGYDWQDICNAYNAQFPNRPREGPGGIQCRYYRCCSDNNIPKVRERRRSASSADEYGMRARTGLYYPWMKN